MVMGGTIPGATCMLKSNFNKKGGMLTHRNKTAQGRNTLHSRKTTGTVENIKNFANATTVFD